MKTIFLLLCSSVLYGQSYEVGRAVFNYAKDSINLTESQYIRLERITAAKITIYSDSSTMAPRAESISRRTGLTPDRVYSIENKVSIIFFYIEN